MKKETKMEDEGTMEVCAAADAACSAAANAVEEDEGFVDLEIHPTTGGHFHLRLHRTDGVGQLKKLISRKLALAKDRICLLHRDRDLREGSLEENEVCNGGKITLLPIVETGLISQKPETSVLQALENLSDAQVNTFLEGKAPLNLSMRLGDHMMFIQLQLSTVNARGPNKPSSQRAPSIRAPSSSSSPSRSFAEASRSLSNTLHHLSSQAVQTSPSPTNTNGPNEGARRPGAIIESMQAHGRGVYSGTFSGTLNPALQDRHGNPKRDISTIVHILNDLLGASPHYRKSRLVAHQAPTPVAIPTEQLESLSLENLTTRGKMEQLQSMLRERQAKRRERRQARATPYAPPLPTPTTPRPYLPRPAPNTRLATPTSVL